MSDIPRITDEQAVRAFEREGFSVVRIRGSHHIMKKPGHPNRLSIPVHAGKIIGKGLLRAQISASGMTVEQFKKLL